MGERVASKLREKLKAALTCKTWPSPKMPIVMTKSAARAVMAVMGSATHELNSWACKPIIAGSRLALASHLPLHCLRDWRAGASEVI